MAAFLVKAAPVIFVLLWSTGFIGAKLGLPYAEPFTFLTVRMLLVAPLLVMLVLLFSRSRAAPRSEIFHSMLTGAMVHGLYLGGVFFAISRGMPAGVSALIVALQPLLTAIFAGFILGERISRRTLFWFIAGLVGVLLVLSPKLFSSGAGEGITVINVASVTISALGISMGAVYQKRFVQKSGLLVSTLWQYVGALILLGILAQTLETGDIVWSGEFIFALAWLVVVLSIGAILLLMYLVRRDSAQQTASLFYLVPAVVAIIAWAMFGEVLEIPQFAGMAVIMIAVFQATRKKA